MRYHKVGGKLDLEKTVRKISSRSKQCVCGDDGFLAGSFSFSEGRSGNAASD